MTSCWRWQVVMIGMLLALASRVQALDPAYCASDNTGSGFQGQYSEYMSNGKCQTACQGSYVFAVIQGNWCWCSNVAPDPALEVTTYDCNQVCPGFQTEWCGSTEANLFVYFNLGGNPTATAGGAYSSSYVAPATKSVSTTRTTSPRPSVLSPLSSSPPSSSRVTTTLDAGTVSPEASRASVVTVVSTQESVQTSTTVVKSTVSATVSAAPSNTYTSSAPPSVSVSTEVVTSAAPTPSTTLASSSYIPPTETQVYTSVMTVTGMATTVLVTPTSALPASTPDPTLGQGATQKSGVSTGAVVGIVVGVALGLGLLIGLLVFFWLRRRHRNQERGLSPGGSYRGSPGRSAAIPSRQVSQLSSSTLLGKAGYKTGLGPSNTTRSADTASSAVDRRSLATDQRLNPYALYSHDEGRHSSVSLQDNQDYSRQLRVANPDL